MDDLISRSAAIALMEKDGRSLGITVSNVCNFKDILRTLPAVDAVPVVRCGECKFRGDGFYCPLVIVVRGNNGNRELDNALDDDFCSRGKPKGAEEDK